MISSEIFKKLLSEYDITLSDYRLLEQAMTHSSYANEHHSLDNERLEFLGDSVLGVLVATYIYKTFPNLLEGEMTKLRATYVCEEANAEYALALGIDKIILLGRGEELGGGRLRHAVLSDAFEAFLGAIYLSSSIDEVQKILEKIVFPEILDTKNEPFVDYKSRLQEYIQAESRSILVYQLDNVDGPPHDRTFTMTAVLDGIKLGTGIGKTKKEATQEAAKMALSKMVK